MPPRANTRRSTRQIKQEPEAEATSLPLTEPPDKAEGDSPVQIRKIDNEDDIPEAEPGAEGSDTTLPDEAEASTAEDTIPVDQQSTPLIATPSLPKTRGPQPAKRFQTRAGIVRKSEADRKKLEQEEAERRQRQLAEATRGQRGSNAGGRGSRGAARGRAGGVAGAKTEKVSGPVGTNWAFERTTTNTPRATLGSERILSELPRTDQGGVDAAPILDTYNDNTGISKGKSAGRGKGKGTAPESVVDEKEDLDRTDIEHINLISDDDEDPDEILGTGRRRHHQTSGQEIGLRPIRLEKHDHIKRAVGVAATKLKSEQMIKEENANDQTEAVRKAREIAAGDASETMQVDQRLLHSPVAKKEVEIKAPSSPEGHKSKLAQRRRPSSKDRRLAHETIEEQQERIRYEKDLRNIGHELGYSGRDVHMADVGSASLADDSIGNARDGKLYLFQLPPMTPMLVRPDDPSQAADDSQPTREATLGTKDPKVKKETGTEEVKATASQVPKILTAGEDRLPGGVVGKLNVHQSGKVTLDWGGTSMVVNWGTEVDFLQDAVLTVAKDENQDQTAYSLAQVRNKFVVTPDWQKIYE